jgi:hypothetical protein
MKEVSFILLFSEESFPLNDFITRVYSMEIILSKSTIRLFQHAHPFFIKPGNINHDEYIMYLNAFAHLSLPMHHASKTPAS